MSNLCSTEIKELVHEPNKINCDSESDVEAIVAFPDEVSLHYFWAWNQQPIGL